MRDSRSRLSPFANEFSSTKTSSEKSSYNKFLPFSDLLVDLSLVSGHGLTHLA